MRWDWYQATVHSTQDNIIGELLASAEGLTLEPCKPASPYRAGASVVQGDTTLARCWWGGVNPHPHVISTGEAAQGVSELLRAKFRHRVSRADACEDFEAEDAWDVMAGLWARTADQHRVTLLHLGDFHRAEKGRTLYLGARTSAVRARVYEKGKELGIDRPIVRAEVQVRPQGYAKAEWAQVTPQQAWGAARWARHLGEELSGVPLARVPAGTLYRPAEAERSRDALVSQYGGVLRAWAKDLGSPEALWRELGKRIGL